MHLVSSYCRNVFSVRCMYGWNRYIYSIICICSIDDAIIKLCINHACKMTNTRKQKIMN